MVVLDAVTVSSARETVTEPEYDKVYGAGADSPWQFADVTAYVPGCAVFGAGSVQVNVPVTVTPVGRGDRTRCVKVQVPPYACLPVTDTCTSGPVTAKARVTGVADLYLAVP